MNTLMNTYRIEILLVLAVLGAWLYFKGGEAKADLDAIRAVQAQPERWPQMTSLGVVQRYQQQIKMGVPTGTVPAHTPTYDLMITSGSSGAGTYRFAFDAGNRFPLGVEIRSLVYHQIVVYCMQNPIPTHPLVCKTGWRG